MQNTLKEMSRLIKQLNPLKREFLILLFQPKKGDSECRLLQVFNIFDSQKVFDKKKLKAQLVEIPSYQTWKNLLFEKIKSGLTEYHFKHSIDCYLKMMMTAVVIFNEGCYEKAMIEFKTIREKAEKEKRWLYAIKAGKYENFCLLKQNGKEIPDLIFELQKKMVIYLKNEKDNLDLEDENQIIIDN